MVHDSANKMISGLVAGQSFAYSYDAAGRRLVRTASGQTSFHAYAGGMEIGEYQRTSVSGSGSTVTWGYIPLRRYVPGGGVDQRAAMITVNSAGSVAQRHYYHVNRLGSLIALADQFGPVTDHYIYTPYGVEEPLSLSGNPFRYTGRRYDGETGW